MLRRGVALAAVFVCWMVLILARLYYLQIIEYVRWLDRAQRQQQRTIELAPQRGTIYDRHQHPLAMSLQVNSIYAVPSHLSDPAEAARQLAAALGMSPRELEARFDSSHAFTWVKRKVSTAESSRVKTLDLKGVYFQKEMKRFYPLGDLAASVLGYVGMDDRGLGGLEYSLNSVIEGKPGHALVMEDARRQTFGSRDDPGQPGMNVELTLDAGVQYIAERVLAADIEKWHAKGGAVVVENPSTGAILAMASYPTFNPNNYTASPPQDRINRGVGWIYEPGSTFKSITISSALEEGVAKPTDLIDCQMGAIVLGGRTIHDVRDAIRHETGPLTVKQVLAYSSDVGAVKVALRLGEDRFYHDIVKFGFGSKTGSGLPGEEQGLLMPPNRWSGVSIGEIAIGQGIGITPLQLTDAYSAIANGGMLIQPRIVKDIFRGRVAEPPEPRIERRVISPQTAAAMRQMLEGVVEFGTGQAAQLEGYSAGGKTGTAQKVENGRYSHTNYVASFIGIAPIHHPAVTILVAIDTPRGGIYGAEVAAPAWKEIAQETLNYLNVPRDEPLESPFEMASNKKAKRMQEFAPPRDTPSLSSRVTLPDPPKLKSVSFDTPGHGNSGTLIISARPVVTVPDFTGLDERKVADECQELGLDLSLSGTGLAVEQNPTPGSKVPEGSQIGVAFAR